MNGLTIIPVLFFMLDLVMPEMDGITFLERKLTIPEIAGIPVIVITADDSPQQQNRLLDM